MWHGYLRNFYRHKYCLNLRYFVTSNIILIIVTLPIIYEIVLHRYR